MKRILEVEELEVDSAAVELRAAVTFTFCTDWGLKRINNASIARLAS